MNSHVDAELFVAVDPLEPLPMVVRRQADVQLGCGEANGERLQESTCEDTGDDRVLAEDQTSLGG